jgi:hypothetical protein
MILYHYTAANRLHSIMREGLTRGDVPITPDQSLNAVWLTTDKQSSDHGLGEARPFTEQERQLIFRERGVMPSEGDGWDNKREVRITIKLPTTDRNLVSWMKWGRKRLEGGWFDTLTKGGGGKRKAETWWLYWGTIRPEQFASVEHL